MSSALAEPAGGATTVSLRPYQEEAVAAALAAYEAGPSQALIALPTGTGKTVVGVHVAAELGGRCLWLVHREELVGQAVEKFEWALPHASIGVVKAKRDDVGADVVVASIQTLHTKRLIRILRHARDSGRPFRLVVCDEAHHAAAASWLKALYATGALPAPATVDAEVEAEWSTDDRELWSLTPEIRPNLLGITATPERHDGLGLDEIFGSKPVYQRTILEMITAGYLCDLRAQTVGRVDLAGVKSVGGDYADGSLADALMRQNVPADLARAYLEYAPERTALVFVPTVEMAHATAEAFRSAGVVAEAVSAGTPTDERAAIIDGIRTRQLQVVVNVGVLTEGFDAPAVDCIIVGRPTKSRPLYTQIVGRGTRLFEGKDDCLILELTASNTAHKIVTVDSLVGRTLRRGKSVLETIEEEQAEAEAAPPDREDDRAEVTAGLNLFSRLRWRAVRNGRFYLSCAGMQFWLVPKGGGLYAGVLKHGQKATRFTERPIRIDYAQGLAEDVLRKHGVNVGWLRNDTAGWRDEPVSAKQVKWLQARGFKVPPGMTKGQGSDIRQDYEGNRGWY